MIGGGPIGLELAQVFGRFGTRVTVIEKMGQVLPREDKELADRLETVLRDEGIDVHTSSDIEGVDRTNGACSLRLRSKAGATATIQAEEILVAIGRAPNVEGLGLEAAGVEVGKRGIAVDERMRTTARHVFAVGDVTGLFPFTHVAEHQAGVAIANALFPLVLRRANSRVIPWVTFTDPELARVGLTEAEARERHGDSVRAYRFDLARFDRALIEGEARGIVKVVCSKRGEILGAHILASGAGELLQEYVLAMSRGVKIGAIARAIHPYPTLVQAAKRAADQYYREKLFTGLAPRISRGLIRLGRLLGRTRDPARS